MDTINGIVERITYSYEENGFSVIKIKARGFADLVTVVGNLAAVNVGSSLQLKGEWRHDSRFGRQFSVIDYKETMPATIAGIEKYLGSGMIKGIGPVFARRIVGHFREDTLRIIEDDADRLIDVPGIGDKRVQTIKKAWQDQKEIKNVMLFLQGNGVSTAYAIKIYKTYGNDSINLVKENPYRLADDIWGIGFRTADRIAQKLGFDPNSYERCRAGIIYVLNDLTNDGHCFATRSQLVEEAAKLLERNGPEIDSVIESMVKEKSVISDEGDSIYLPSLYFSEVGAAKGIARINSAPSIRLEVIVDDILDSIQKEYGITYDDIQKDAVRNAVSSKFMVLTGGPGTGKTTTTLAIIKVFRRLGMSVLLAAPTGRAAKRLSEATGMEAKTIHRLLEFKPPEGFKKNQESPLECDVLILDETSMVDITLINNLMKALKDETTVIMVGDIDQLPSVGAGNVLRDIIDSGIVSVTRLTRIFRQAMGSAIITNAHRVNKGEMPFLKGKRDGDFFFIEEEDPIKIAETIKELCSSRLPSYYKADPINDLQVLCPMLKGETGAQNLNLVLQEILNPSEVTIKYGASIYKP
jgi:exodeoxyribonuclease V alpha subunit